MFDISEQELRELVDDGKIDREIANLLGCSKGTVWKARTRFGIKATDRSKGITEDRLRGYVDDGMSDKEIAEIYGTTPNVIRKHRQKHGIKRPRKTQSIPDETLRGMYERGDSVKDIANTFGCSQYIVMEREYELGLSEDAIGTRYGMHADDVRRYVRDGKTDIEIAAIYGCRKPDVWRFRKRHDIERTRIEKGLSRVTDEEFDRLVSSGLDDEEIAEKTGYTLGTVREKREKRGILKKRDRSDVDEDSLKRMFDDGKTDAEIAERFGVSTSSVKARRMEFGLSRDNSVTLPPDISSMYVDGMSMVAIADRFGCSPSTIRERLLDDGIEIRQPHQHEEQWSEFAEYAKSIYAVKGALDITETARYFDVSEQCVSRHARQEGVISLFDTRYSSPETSWKRWLEELGFHEGSGSVIADDEYVHNDRTTLTGIGNSGYPLEIDFLIPSRHLGIEVSPTWTHSSDGASYMRTVPQGYHQKKSLCAMERGVNLITVYDWEDEDKLKDIIRTRLGLNERIGARECVICHPSVSEEREFLRGNHLQGYVKSDICLGLRRNDRLVSVMTFGVPRFNHDFQFELLRFACLEGTSIIGGASRLFKAFIREQSPRQVMSYASLDISNGDLYKRLGFTMERVTRPSYEWVNPMDASEHYSWSLILNKGVDNVLGTHYGKGTDNIELMKRLGYVRVFNSGSMVFVWERGE